MTITGNSFLVTLDDFTGVVQPDKMFSRTCTFLPGVLVPEGSPDPVWHFGGPPARRSVEEGGAIMEMTVVFPSQNNGTSNRMLSPRQAGPLVERLAPNGQEMGVRFGDDMEPGTRIRIVGVGEIVFYLNAKC